jgi:hypothetical protein
MGASMFPLLPGRKRRYGDDGRHCRGRMRDARRRETRGCAATAARTLLSFLISRSDIATAGSRREPTDDAAAAPATSASWCERLHRRASHSA